MRTINNVKDLMAHINRAVVLVGKRTAERLQCPKCGEKDALCTLSFRRQLLTYLCRFCAYAGDREGEA